MRAADLEHDAAGAIAGPDGHRAQKPRASCAARARPRPGGASQRPPAVAETVDQDPRRSISSSVWWQVPRQKTAVVVPDGSAAGRGRSSVTTRPRGGCSRLEDRLELRVGDDAPYAGLRPVDEEVGHAQDVERHSLRPRGRARSSSHGVAPGDERVLDAAATRTVRLLRSAPDLRLRTLRAAEPEDRARRSSGSGSGRPGRTSVVARLHHER